MELYKAARRRRSIRNYPEKGLTQKQLNKVERASASTREFHSDISTGAWLVRNGQDFQKDISGILADYGKIEAPHYLVLTSKDTPEGHLELGYRYEFLVLTLASMDIGTCWIGKGFRDEKLSNHVRLSPDQTCVTLVALGPLPEDDELHEIKNPKRKEIRHFLLNQNPEGLSEKILDIIDCLRRAPSALNGQPWRVIVEGCQIHLFLKKKNKITRMDNLKTPPGAAVI